MGKDKSENTWREIRFGAGSLEVSEWDGKLRERKIESIWRWRLKTGKVWVDRWKITGGGRGGKTGKSLAIGSKKEGLQDILDRQGETLEPYQQLIHGVTWNRGQTNKACWDYCFAFHNRFAFLQSLSIAEEKEKQREEQGRRKEKEEREERGGCRGYEETVVGKDKNEEEKVAPIMPFYWDLKGCSEHSPCRTVSRAHHLLLSEIASPSPAFTPHPSGPLDFRDAVNPVRFISHGIWKVHIQRQGWDSCTRCCILSWSCEPCFTLIDYFVYTARQDT